MAMHVAAANPQYLNRQEVPAEVVEKEKEIMRAKAKESGKPDNIIEKIIEGQVNKFFGEVCLLEQAFVIDPDQKVGKVVEALGKEIGAYCHPQPLCPLPARRRPGEERRRFRRGSRGPEQINVGSSHGR